MCWGGATDWGGVYFFSLSPSPPAPDPDDMRVTPVDDMDVIIDEDDPAVDAAAADVVEVAEDENVDEGAEETKGNDDDDDEGGVEKLLDDGDTREDTGTVPVDTLPAGPGPVSDDDTDTDAASVGSLGGSGARLPGRAWGCGYSPRGGFTSPKAPTGSIEGLAEAKLGGYLPPTPNPTGFPSWVAGTGVTTGAELHEVVVVAVVMVAVVAAVAGRGWGWGWGRPTRGDCGSGSGLM